ncbi:MAG: BON domain-containing protein [Magnetococcales bacterium]|nr:BON domain-containing protein [Magnetococcales bacterium]
MNKLLRIMLALFFMSTLTSCLSTGTTGTTGTTGSGQNADAATLGKSRGIDDYLEDNWLAAKVRIAYVKSEKVSAGNVNVSVYKGKVLLTGTAASNIEIQEAITIARNTAGVEDVASELKVQYESALELAADALISNKVKFALLTDEEVRGLDIHVETTKKVVYLTGVAKDLQERNRAIDLARSVNDVVEVVSYIEVDANNYPVSSQLEQTGSGKL